MGLRSAKALSWYTVRMPTYHIWTIGCQMNAADSERLGAALDALGYATSPTLEEADVIVLNSCVVRQGAEDKVAGRLGSLKSLKREHPEKVISLMGCMVGPKQDDLKRRFPYVDVFMRPQQFEPLVKLIEARDGTCLDRSGGYVPQHPNVATFVPIIHGCDKFCTFCIIPYRRGRERSRPVEELVREGEMLAARGVKEVTLLGQNVDSYGHDLEPRHDLADLLYAMHDIEGLQRIRFLTSHPNDMSDHIIHAVAELPKACEHINLPVQAGDDRVLAAMRRGYTAADYLRLVDRIRNIIPDVSMSTDVIVGFPGETAEQFQHTLDLLEQVRFDKVHVAAYSPRPGTIAWRTLPDDVLREEKQRRLSAIEELQERVATELNLRLLGTAQEVLVEGVKDGKGFGRTRTNKLAHLNDAADRVGQIIQARITDTSPWYLMGEVAPLPVGV